MTVNPLPSTSGLGRITCHYVNKTTKLQIVRIANIPGYFFERAVFAGQQLFIDVDSEAVLEIHSHELASAIVRDRIPCRQLRYAEPLALPQSVMTVPTDLPKTDLPKTDLPKTDFPKSGQMVA